MEREERVRSELVGCAVGLLPSKTSASAAEDALALVRPILAFLNHNLDQVSSGGGASFFMIVITFGSVFFTRYTSSTMDTSTFAFSRPLRIGDRIFFFSHFSQPKQYVFEYFAQLMSFIPPSEIQLTILPSLVNLWHGKNWRVRLGVVQSLPCLYPSLVCPCSVLPSD